MVKTDVIIVGGGPAGASCARRLRENGADCLVLDQRAFPRVKPCAGWITPEVVKEIGLDPERYPGSFTTFASFEVAVRGISFHLRTRQHAIRRVEFDHWLLQQANVPVHTHAVKTITEIPGGYDIDGEYQAAYLVGAGGTYCPVYRALFKPDTPREKGALIAAQEEEFPYPYRDARCYLWFLQDGLPGYAWYVPKANGYLNVGVGGKAAQMAAGGDSLKRHWGLLIEKLERLGLVTGHDYQPVAHSYYLRQRLKQVRKGNALLCGDSAGLATLDMGEGIGPAILSGLRAAGTILRGTPYTFKGIPRYSALSLLRWGLRGSR